MEFIKYIVFAFVLGFVYYMGYRQGKNNQELKNLKGDFNAFQKANQIRSGLSDTAILKQLHQKYKR